MDCASTSADESRIFVGSIPGGLLTPETANRKGHWRHNFYLGDHLNNNVGMFKFRWNCRQLISPGEL